MVDSEKRVSFGFEIEWTASLDSWSIEEIDSASASELERTAGAGDNARNYEGARDRLDPFCVVFL